jgi:tryptophan synthase alpha chain
MHALVGGGADIIELGVPFSDPMADGPTIQRANERALRSHVGLKDVLGLVAEFRATDTATPVVLMGYANPIEHLGAAPFAAGAASSGVDGVLVVDYPPEESVDLVTALSERGIDSIFLLAPTSTEARIRQVAAVARGYIYYVSLKGVTGATTIDLTEVAGKIARIKSYSKLPVGVGFGIRDGPTAAAVARYADAVVIGSRLVEEIERSPKEVVCANVGQLTHQFRVALDGG